MGQQTSNISAPKKQNNLFNDDDEEEEEVQFKPKP